MNKMPGFCITPSFGTNSDECSRGKGFKITFRNGITISVQFGYGSYADGMRYDSELRSNVSETCEIAIIDDTGNFVTKDVVKEMGLAEIYDDVIGYVSPDDLAELITASMEYKA